MITGKRSTIKDVAQRAGVSTATVSFVLNDNPNETISTAVRRRVLDAARDLNYHASAAAASLARKRVGNVGLIFYREHDSIGNQFYSFVVEGAVREAIDHGYNLLFSYVDSPYRDFSDLPKMVREKNADGVLFMRRILPKMIEDILKLGLPVVCADAFPRVPGVNLALIDDRRGGALAAEHLLGLGHEQLAMLVPRGAVASIKERLAGFREGLEAHGHKFSKANIVDAANLTFEAGAEGTQQALSQNPALTALFAANDEMAAGALRAARALGRHVPDNLSIVGFDDIAMSNFTDPPLTTISVAKHHLGRRAMARLIELIEHVDKEVKVELAPVELVVRGSTGPRAPARAARKRGR